MTERKLKKKEFTDVQCYIINVKIHSDEKDKQNLYSSIFTQIFNLKDFFVKIGSKNGLALRKLDKYTLSKKDFGSEFNSLENDNFQAFVGEFIKFRIEDESDQHYNTISKELKSGDPNSIEKPNATKISFYIIPLIHRIFLPINSKITPIQLKNFVEQALLEIYETEDYFNVDIAKSSDLVDKIYEFKSLKKLKLLISYTNDDLGGNAKEFMDLVLKEGNITTFDGTYTAEKKESLNMESRLVKGGIELSKENGELIAVGENSFGNREVINTKNKYEKYSLRIKKGLDPIFSLIKDTITNWRL